MMNDAPGFMPHGMCFLWQPDILALHTASNVLIAFSYFCIPVLLLQFARRRPAFYRFGWFFSAFILSCGLTHVMDVWTIWHPDYWVSGVLLAITAVASLGTVVALLPLMPYARALGRISALDRLNRELDSYRLIVETSNDGVWFSNAAGRTTSVNAQMTKMLGFTAAEIADEPLTAFMHEETGIPERARFTRAAAAVTLSEEPLEVCLRHKDGSPVWTEVHTAPFTDADGQGIGTVAVVRDLTQRRHDRRALAESELRYRTLAESMPHGTFTTNPTGASDYCNRTLLDYIGLSEEEACGAAWSSTVHPQDLPGSAAAWTRALESGEPLETQQRIRRASDGMYRWFIVRATSIRDATGTIVKWIGSATDIHDYKVAAQTRGVLDTMGHLIAIRNDDGFEYISPSWGLYTGMPNGDATSPEWRTYIHPEDMAVLDRQVRAIRESRVSAGECELRLRSADGRYRWFLARTAALTEADGTAHRVNIWTDIDDLKRAQIAFEASEARYRALTDSMPLIVWMIDDRFNMTFANEGWSTFTGLTCALGKPSITASFLHPDDTAVRAGAIQAVQTGRSFECEGRLLRHDGTYRWHLVRGVPLGDLPQPDAQWVITAMDIEALKSAEAALANSVAELTHRAHHDPLTRMPNRTRLMEQLTLMIAQAEREHTSLVVLYLDVDHFKAVNDTLGHDGGDQLLVAISARINDCLRADDVASRLGGDEFVVVFEGDTVEAAAIAQRLQLVVRAPLEINGTRVVVGSSIGMSVYPADGETARDLVLRADAAMYVAKRSGRDAWSFYNAQTALPTTPALELELELREAIARQEFVVFYQPIFDMASERPVGAEALVRWAHPERGLVMPGEFIAFAEEHGMVAQIGEFVLNAACAQLQRLRLEPSDPFSIAVNVSAHQFVKPGFVGTIVAAISTSGIDPWRLEIEITESVVMAEAAVVIETLNALKELGVRLSMDDFGTGYSSLAYIKHFPIHTLKIDRSFIIDIATSVTDLAIAKTIVTLAHSLGMRTVAEGVETADQLEYLRSLGADCIQGYLFSRPLCATDFENFLGRHPVAN